MSGTARLSHPSGASERITPERKPTRSGVCSTTWLATHASNPRCSRPIASSSRPPRQTTSTSSIRLTSTSCTGSLYFSTSSSREAWSTMRTFQPSFRGASGEYDAPISRIRISRRTPSSNTARRSNGPGGSTGGSERLLTGEGTIRLLTPRAMRRGVQRVPVPITYISLLVTAQSGTRASATSGRAATPRTRWRLRATRSRSVRRRQAGAPRARPTP